MPAWGDLPFEYGSAPYGFGPYGGDILVPEYTSPGLTLTLASLATAQDALNATYTHPRRTVYVGGVMLPIIAYTGQHDVGKTATGRLTMTLPQPDAVIANATVEVQGGRNDYVGTEFSGYIPTWEGSISSRGDLLEVQIVGWSELMKEPFRSDLVYDGPVGLDALFVSLCQLCGVPSWIAESTTYADNVTPVMLGGNSMIDDGAITIKAHSSPLSQLQRLAEPYCYYISDTEMGPVKLHRVGGAPSGDPVVTFSEGVHLKSAKRTYDTREIVNVWDVNGQTYDDEWGGKVPIRSIADPDSVPAHDEIRNGYRYRRTQNSDIVRQDQADAIRNWLEINSSEANTPVRWDAPGIPGIAPGDCVEVVSDTLGVNARYWLMGIDIGSDDRGGYTGTYEGWLGAGDEYPGIVDRVTIPIQTEATHLGDETRSNYAHPSPQGASKEWTVTVPIKATTVNVRLLCHGANSQLQNGTDNTDLEVSKFELWREGEDRAESSGNLPVLDENLRQNLDYTNTANWSHVAVNLRNTDEGEITLKLIAGQASGLDDFEVRDIELEVWGSTEAAGYDEVEP